MPKKLLAVVILTGSAVLIAPGPAPDDAPVHLADSCRITMEPLVELGGDVVAQGILRGDSEGYWFVPYYSGYEIVRFDTQGEFRHVIGRKGLGPKEFNSIRDVVPLGDGLAVFQAEPARLTYLNANGDVISTHPLPIAMRSVAVGARPDSTFLLTGYPLLPGTTGAAFVRVDREGRLLAAFTEGVEQPFSGVPGHVIPRLTGFRKDGRPVSAEIYALSLEQWMPTGKLLGRQHREVDWFQWPGDLPKYLRHGPGGSPGPPENVFMGLQVDEAERVWLMARVTPDDWQDGVEGSEVVDETAWADGFIHVMDADSGAAICSLRLDQVPLPGFVAPGQIATYAEDSKGIPTITVWQLSLST